MMMKYRLLLFTNLVSFVACSQAPGRSGGNQNLDCGNGVREAGEQCEEEDLDGQTCESLGFSGGTLACASCMFDTSGCSGCGNGVCDPAETRSGCPADCGVKQIASGYSNTCTAMGDGTVWCWGGNIYGELGNGTTEGSAVPVQVNGLENAVSLCAGGYHSCAALADGTAWCWGRNENGMLGNGTITQRETTPVKVLDVAGAVAIGCGDNHTCVLMDAGSVRCWGDNSVGQLGDGNAGQDSASPVLVDSLTDAASIAAGSYHACAALAGGTAWCWGENTAGELGIGQVQTDYSDVPRLVVDLTNVMHLATNSGAVASCAIQSNASLWCWGGNELGNLGDGTYDNIRPIPAQVAGMEDVVTASIGASHTCAVTHDGSAYCWGVVGSSSYQFGQLGNGLYSGSVVPVQVVGLQHVVGISTGSFITCAALSNGSAWCWGSNYNGLLGVGDQPESSPVPLQVAFP